ncbi:hypothetical protein LT85_1020 [Collimonas arenae]|uniref:Uncharacterized protein n=1 Tax=Collimonas arenae TaxID=279058 RepID=A0A0A1F644_9BURK|nr:hypothetical protein [Collimonas arenae]AIY40178.1 hypothetical protein LT85_1020 [Collimonas arenae]
MEQTEAQAINDGHIIERLESGLPVYFSVKIGRDFGQPAGGWTDDRTVATVYKESDALNLLSNGLASLAPFCKVVAK